MYKNKIDEDVLNVVKQKSHEFYGFLKSNQKIDFVKFLKYYTGLGLREAKDISDVIFNDGILSFEKNFILKVQRKEKLELLKKKHFLKELVNRLKLKSEDELLEDLSTLDIEILEDLLNSIL